jgi:hypothetical protein
MPNSPLLRSLRLRGKHLTTSSAAAPSGAAGWSASLGLPQFQQISPLLDIPIALHSPVSTTLLQQSWELSDSRVSLRDFQFLPISQPGISDSGPNDKLSRRALRRGRLERLVGATSIPGNPITFGHSHCPAFAGFYPFAPAKLGTLRFASFPPGLSKLPYLPAGNCYRWPQRLSSAVPRQRHRLERLVRSRLNAYHQLCKPDPIPSPSHLR